MLNFLKKYRVLALLAGVLFLSFLLRAWDLGHNSFVADEFIDLDAGYGYEQTGEWHAWDFNREQPDTVDFFAPRDERSWVYRWQVAKVFSIFGVSEESARSVSVLWGVITTLVIFWSARIFTRNETVALLAAFLFATSVTGIEYDRKLRMYAMFTPVFLILSTWLFLFLETKFPYQKPVFLKKISSFFGVNLMYFIPVIFAGILSVHLQLLTANIAFSLLGYFITVACVARFYPKFQKSKSTAWGLGIFFIGILLSATLFPQVLQSILGTAKFFMDNYGYVGKMLRDFQHPVLGALLIILGSCWLFSVRKKPKEALWLVTSFLVPLLLTIFIWSRTQGTQYVFYLTPFVIILTASGAFSAFEWLRSHTHDTSQKKLLAIVIILALLLIPRYGYFWEGNTTYDRDNDSVANYKKAFSYLKKKREDDGALITRNFRNYYYRGWDAPVLDFGGERADHDLTKEEMQSFMCQHPNGFVVIFDNDWNYIKKDARTFVETTLEKVDHSSVRGAAKAYIWNPENFSCPNR